ncbi:MAG: hypothetical protein P4M08_11825 [Oligoflexia bacterium]|nr:hypothetical protein [Oligoflexia bacterium]
MADKTRPLTLVAQPQEYFRELVTDALGKQKIATQPETEFYLVNLLNQFITTDRLYARDGEGAVREEPLVLMIKEAIEQPEKRTQSVLFRHVGDVSLYTAGFFQDSLARKLVDVDYYIGMGETAYKQVAVRTEEEAMRSLYEELAQKFASFVEVLATISDRTAPRSEKDLLRLYDLWLRTKSERAAKALQEAGILPTDTTKKDWQ